MVLEPGGGLSFPPPPGGGTAGSGGSILAPARLFQRATPVFPFHLAGWPSHHAAVLGNVQNQVQQTMQAQHQAAAAAAVRFLSHHPHHSHPALTSHPLIPGMSHHPGAPHIQHSNDHQDDDDDKKGSLYDFKSKYLMIYLRGIGESWRARKLSIYTKSQKDVCEKLDCCFFIIVVFRWLMIGLICFILLFFFRLLSRFNRGKKK